MKYDQKPIYEKRFSLTLHRAMMGAKCVYAATEFESNATFPHTFIFDRESIDFRSKNSKCFYYDIPKCTRKWNFFVSVQFTLNHKVQDRHRFLIMKKTQIDLKNCWWVYNLCLWHISGFSSTQLRKLHFRHLKCKSIFVLYDKRFRACRLVQVFGLLTEQIVVCDKVRILNVIQFDVWNRRFACAFSKIKCLRHHAECVSVFVWMDLCVSMFIFYSCCVYIIQISYMHLNIRAF